MLTVAQLKAKDRKYYEKNKAAIMERRAAYEAANGGAPPDTTKPEVMQPFIVEVANGFPFVKTPALDRIKFRLEKEAA